VALVLAREVKAALDATLEVCLLGFVSLTPTYEAALVGWGEQRELQRAKSLGQNAGLHSMQCRSCGVRLPLARLP
jgi:hypothetical protein